VHQVRPAKLPTLETARFDLPSARPLAEVRERLLHHPWDGEIRRFADWWRVNEQSIGRVLSRAEELGAQLRQRRLTPVVAHGDAHAGNVLADQTSDAIWLVDWDEVALAPRERDRIFVIGSHIARPVLPHEEAAFFAGYGPVGIDADAVRFFRYERVLDDLAAFGRSMMDDAALDEAGRAEIAALTGTFLAPGGPVDSAEVVEPQAPDVVVHEEPTGR
jgi:spectinomycin phosphotransferase